MFARHYLRNLGWFLFLELLRCFSSLGSPPCPYIFRTGYPCGWVSPFGYVRIKAYLPAPRTFTQAITSFIACNRQGIHHMHLFAWSYNVKTWTLLNIQISWCMRTSAIVFSKATLWALQGCTVPTGLFHLHVFQELSFWNSCKAKCFDFAINYYPFWIHTYHHNNVYSLYFFHFVKEQSS
jgi:hypothetical protein